MMTSSRQIISYKYLLLNFLSIPLALVLVHYNNIPSVIPQVGFGEGSVYANLTPTLCEVERFFLIDHQLKESVLKTRLINTSALSC